MNSDFKAADRFYARALKLDAYDESTQVNYLDFLEGLEQSPDGIRPGANTGRRDRLGSQSRVHDAVRGNSYGWERWSNPRAEVRSHRTYWYHVETAKPIPEPLLGTERLQLGGEHHRPSKAESC